MAVTQFTFTAAGRRTAKLEDFDPVMCEQRMQVVRAIARPKETGVGSADWSGAPSYGRSIAHLQ